LCTTSIYELCASIVSDLVKVSSSHWY